MKNNPFWKYLGFLSIVTAIVLVIVYQIDVFKPDILLSILGLVFMASSAAGLYIASKKAIASTNKMAFIQLVMGNVVFKLVFILGIVATYFKLVKPETKLFVVPFMIIYFIFTIFETIFIYKISNNNNSKI
jgi:hypothetical protein